MGAVCQVSGRQSKTVKTEPAATTRRDDSLQTAIQVTPWAQPSNTSILQVVVAAAVPRAAGPEAVLGVLPERKSEYKTTRSAAVDTCADEGGLMELSTVMIL